MCIGGSRAAPPEDCGGPVAFQERRDAAPWQARELLKSRIASTNVTSPLCGTASTRSVRLRNGFCWISSTGGKLTADCANTRPVMKNGSGTESPYRCARECTDVILAERTQAGLGINLRR